MNERFAFNGPEVTMQKDCKLIGDLEHRDVHNLYGMMLYISTYGGHYRRSEGKLRPFVLTRSIFAGKFWRQLGHDTFERISRIETHLTQRIRVHS